MDPEKELKILEDLERMSQQEGVTPMRESDAHRLQELRNQQIDGAIKMELSPSQEQLEPGALGVGPLVDNFDPNRSGVVAEPEVTNYTAMATEMALEFIGGITGVGVGLPAGGPIGGIAGGAIGAGTGQAVFQRLQAEFPDVFGEPPQSVEEAATDIGISTAFGAAGEMLPGAARGTKNFIKKKLAEKGSEIRPAEREMAEFLREEGMDAIPPSILFPDSKTAAISENVAGASFFTDDFITGAKKSAESIVDSAIQNKALGLTQGASREEIASIVKEVIENKHALLQESMDDVMQNLDEITFKTGGLPISDLALEIADNLRNIPRGIKTRSESKALDSLVDRLIDEPAGKIKFTDAQAVIDDLTTMIDKLKGRGKSLLSASDRKTLTTLEGVRATFFNNMKRSALASGDPTIKNSMKVLEKMMVEGPTKFNNRFFAKVLTMSDTAALDLISSLKDPKQIRELSRILGKDAWRRVRGLHMQSMIGRSMKHIDGVEVVSGDRLLDVMADIERQGIMDAIHGGSGQIKGIAPLKKFAGRLAALQRDPASDLGRVFIELAQAGAVTSLAFGALTPQAFTIVFGPAAIQKVLSNPKLTQILLDGMTQPEYSLKYDAGALFLSTLAKAGIDYQIESDNRGSNQNNPFEGLGFP